MNVLIANGTSKFHLSCLAAQMDKAGLLSGFLTAAWPSKWQRVAAKVLLREKVRNRFFDRFEPINERLVHSMPDVELLAQLSSGLRGRIDWIADLFDASAHRAFAQRASVVLEKRRPTLYHFRSCFGLKSAEVAKRLGIQTVCDHSIAHPALLSTLVENSGRLEGCRLEIRSSLEKRMNEDLQLADWVFVNSQFVKDTCVRAGMVASKIKVIYWGVDNHFIDGVPKFDATQVQSRQGDRLLYAGAWQKRKGVDRLTDALRSLPRVRLEVAGPWRTEDRNRSYLNQLEKEGRLKWHGTIARSSLAQLMHTHRIFVFPSLCEGSARVIFEAMACGCYVITTANAGSVVVDGKHGRIVLPGQSESIVKAVEWALDNPAEVSRIGWANACEVRSRYTEAQYAINVQQAYREVIESN